MRCTVLVAITVAVAACGGSSSGVRSGEDVPAPPCSVNGMLFRDTPSTGLTQCGEASPPLSGEVLECVESAMAREQPFLVGMKASGLVPPRRSPALVGAEFDGQFALRMYTPSEDGSGQREPVELIRTSPDARELALKVSLGHTRRCVLATDPPDPSDAGWIDVDGDRRHKFHPDQCLEWFDAAAWNDAPWTLRFDPNTPLACEG